MRELKYDLWAKTSTKVATFAVRNYPFGGAWGLYGPFPKTFANASFDLSCALLSRSGTAYVCSTLIEMLPLGSLLARSGDKPISKQKTWRVLQTCQAK